MSPATHRLGGIAAIFLVTASAAAALGIGFWVSHGTGDWTAFSRSGSVLVVLGIVFAFFNVDGFIERSLRIAMLSREGVAEGTGLSARLRRRLTEDETDIPNTVKAIEVVIIVLGTVVWGFGDLIGG